jgi:hypothetical protein
MAALTAATTDFLASGDSEALWSKRGNPLDYNTLFTA